MFSPFFLLSASLPKIPDSRIWSETSLSLTSRFSIVWKSSFIASLISSVSNSTSIFNFLFLISSSFLSNSFFLSDNSWAFVTFACSTVSISVLSSVASISVRYSLKLSFSISNFSRSNRFPFLSLNPFFLLSNSLSTSFSSLLHLSISSWRASNSFWSACLSSTAHFSCSFSFFLASSKRTCTSPANLMILSVRGFNLLFNFSFSSSRCLTFSLVTFFLVFIFSTSFSRRSISAFSFSNSLLSSSFLWHSSLCCCSLQSFSCKYFFLRNRSWSNWYLSSSPSSLTFSTTRDSNFCTSLSIKPALCNRVFSWYSFIERLSSISSRLSFTSAICNLWLLAFSFISCGGKTASLLLFSSRTSWSFLSTDILSLMTLSTTSSSLLGSFPSLLALIRHSAFSLRTTSISCCFWRSSSHPIIGADSFPRVEIAWVKVSFTSFGS